MADSLLKFFTSMDSQGVLVVREAPKLDLDLYIQNYAGRTRFERLFHIGRTSVPLCVDALKAAIAEAKKGSDVHRYREAWDCIRNAAPEEPEAVFDRAWVDQTEKANKTEIQRLETELKGYKNNLIKESIRMGHEDLGKFLESTGDLDGAGDIYARMRPDISSPKHVVDAHKRLASVAIQRRDWGMVLVNCAKMSGQLSAEEDKALQTYVAITKGVADLGQEKYIDAANDFLDADSSTPFTAWNEIASPNDVAVYGGLLALAFMDRKAIETRVLENSSFRGFLELEPQIRRALTQFVNGRYSSCIAILESYRADYLLDIYLQKHVSKIYGEIRAKCIVQYLVPFSCVTLDSMNENFAGPGQSIEGELVGMIQSGILDARINSIDELVVKLSTDSRAAVQNLALETARAYEREAIERLRRMSIVAAGLEVKGQRKILMSRTLDDSAAEKTPEEFSL